LIEYVFSSAATADETSRANATRAAGRGVIRRAREFKRIAAF
jgi:hypothetical protein